MSSINHTLTFIQPANEVWAYLTDPDLMAIWLMKNDFRPEVGHQFRFITPPMPHIGFDGITYCTVLEIVDNEKLSYSWKCGPGDGKITLDSVVTWTLEEKDGKTELHLQHTGFKDAEHFTIYSIMDIGWLKNMQKISGLIANKKQ